MQEQMARGTPRPMPILAEGLGAEVTGVGVAVGLAATGEVELGIAFVRILLSTAV